MAEGIVAAWDEFRIGLLAGLVVTCAVADEGIRIHFAGGGGEGASLASNLVSAGTGSMFMRGGSTNVREVGLLVCWLYVTSSAGWVQRAVLSMLGSRMRVMHDSP